MRTTQENLSKKKKKTENGEKKLNTEEIENIIKDKREELHRTIQKKLFLEKKLNEKNEELENFRKEYKELQNHINSIDEKCNEYTEHLKEEKHTIHKKSVFYNYQHMKEMQKVDKERKKLEILINKKHEESMNNLMHSIEAQRLNLESIKNKNFNEICQLNEEFNLKSKEIEESFTAQLEEFESEKQEEIEKVIEDYNIMEKNEIIFLKNLYSDHIKEINDIHENLIQELKKYYIDLIKENLLKLKNLKEKINELDTNEKVVKNELLLCHNESLSITENIKNLEMKREDLKKDLKFYSKDFVLYKNLELIYNETDIHIKNLKIVSENMKEQINEIQHELVRLSEEINVENYFDQHRKKNMFLKKKVEELNLNLEDVHKELKSYLNMHNIKEADVVKVKTGTEFILNTLNKEFDHLRHEERKIKKKMKENANIYEKKLKDLNIQKNI